MKELTINFDAIVCYDAKQLLTSPRVLSGWLNNLFVKIFKHTWTYFFNPEMHMKTFIYNAKRKGFIDND